MEGNAEQTFQPRTFSIKLWPPSEKTRQMLVERMTKNLSSESIFSRKYGLLSEEEAAVDAKEIEEIGFNVANEHFINEPDGDGSAAVQLYAKETSKLMIEAIKRGPRPKKEQEHKVEAVPEVEAFFDISKSRRDFLDAEEAKDLFQPLAKEGNSYTRICLSNRSFGVEAARVVEPILSSVKHQLTQVDLSDCVAGRPEEEALEVMEILSFALEGSVLRILDLSNNALGEKGVRAFGSLLRSQSNLEEIYLINDGISPEAANAVSELLPSTDKLKILHFHNNMTGDEGAFAISDILKRSPLLEDFRCSSTRVDADGGLKLVEGLETCKNLKKIDLRDNMFGVEAGTALSKVLGNFEGLTEIYLSYLNLEDEGTIAISNALKEAAPSLKVLDFAGNEITKKSVPALVSCIQSKQLLTKLNLSENELNDEGAVLVGKVLEEGHAHLEELDVSTNSIKRVGARAIAKAVVSKKPNFTLLNLNGNAISDEGIDEVKEILKSGKKSADVLGPLDENDVEGEYDEEEEEREETDNEERAAEDAGEAELESKLQDLKVEQ